MNFVMIWIEEETIYAELGWAHIGIMWVALVLVPTYKTSIGALFT